MANTPSLLNNNQPSQNFTFSSGYTTNNGAERNLLDIMYDGFYALFLLKNDNAPKDETAFLKKLQGFLASVDNNAKKLGISADDVYAAKYAYCAAVDEIVLRSSFSIRASWERHPLQLVLFGEQLAGENFFKKLEELRLKGPVHIQALEVFYMCLLLGFQGRYLLESPEKLPYLTARLGEEIANIKGKSAGFSPFWERPDQVSHRLRSETPLWVVASILALVSLLAFIGINKMLTKHTTEVISQYNDIIQMAPHQASFNMMLP